MWKAIKNCKNWGCSTNPEEYKRLIKAKPTDINVLPILPNEILYKIFDFLSSDVKTLVQCSHVCRTWNSIINDVMLSDVMLSLNQIEEQMNNEIKDLQKLLEKKTKTLEKLEDIDEVNFSLGCLNLLLKRVFLPMLITVGGITGGSLLAILAIESETPFGKGAYGSLAAFIFLISLCPAGYCLMKFFKDDFPRLKIRLSKTQKERQEVRREVRIKQENQENLKKILGKLKQEQLGKLKQEQKDTLKCKFSLFSNYFKTEFDKIKNDDVDDVIIEIPYNGSPNDFSS